MFEFLKRWKKPAAQETPKAAPTIQAPKPAPQAAPAQESPFAAVKGTPEIDDISFIKDIHHATSGPWHQYDILLDSRGYGWEFMVDHAAYMAAADLDSISTVTVSENAGAPERELIDAFRPFHEGGGTLKTFDALQPEHGALAIGGISRTLGAPVKFVWLNQTRVMRLFTVFRDDEKIIRYFETVIRRTFNTPDAMKLARRREQ